MQDIENKKTILEDDASIYQKKEDREETKSVKQKWKELDGHGKWLFFRDYYLLKLIIALFALGLVGSMLYTTLKPKPDDVLFVVMVDGTLDQEVIDDYVEHAYERLGYDPAKHNITWPSTYSTQSPSDGTTLSAYIYAGTIDVIIAAPDSLAGYLKNGVLLPLDDYLPNDIREAVTEDQLFFYTPEGEDQKPVLYGVRIADTELVRKADIYDTKQDYIFTISITSKTAKEGNPFRLLRDLLGLPQVEDAADSEQ